MSTYPETCNSRQWFCRNHHVAIVMSDITCNTSSFPAFVRLFAVLVNLGSPDAPPGVVPGYRQPDQGAHALGDGAGEPGGDGARVG